MNIWFSLGWPAAFQSRARADACDGHHVFHVRRQRPLPSSQVHRWKHKGRWCRSERRWSCWSLPHKKGTHTLDCNWLWHSSHCEEGRDFQPNWLLWRSNTQRWGVSLQHPTPLHHHYHNRHHHHHHHPSPPHHRHLNHHHDQVRVSDQLPASGQQMFTGGRLLGRFEGPAENGQKISITGQQQTNVTDQKNQTDFNEPTSSRESSAESNSRKYTCNTVKCKKREERMGTIKPF